MNMQYTEYRRKLEGCYTGKCIGGTLGMPFEGQEQLLNLSYYDPVPTEMMANDDLDLQVVWLESVRRHGLPVNRRYLAKGWTENIRCLCDEYGVAQRNVRHKIFPPASGAFDNKFYAGMGAAIRTELWACLCPGDPDLAVKLAMEDACNDHVNDGVDAACFLAALESAAFVEQDRNRLLEIAFSYLPPEGRLRAVLEDTIRWWTECRDFIQVRQRVLEQYYVQNWTDVSLNLSFILLGLLEGGGDFGKSICIAVNCGNDTDCTGATLGALLGILEPEAIGEEWKRPIGNKLVLSANMVGTHEVETVEQMCDQIAALSMEVQRYYGSPVKLIDCPALPDYAIHIAPPWKSRPDGTQMSRDTSPRESVVQLTPVYTVLRYPERMALPPNQNGSYELDFLGLDDRAAAYEVDLRVPDGWTVRPSRFQVNICGADKTTIRFLIQAPESRKNACSNFLDIHLKNETVRVDMTAGLATTIDWLRMPLTSTYHDDEEKSILSRGERTGAYGHYQSVPEGGWLLAAEFKTATPVSGAVLVAEGSRTMRVWIDGVRISETDGKFYVPACHRGRERVRYDARDTWQRVFIELPEEPAGEIFFGIFKPYGQEWIEDVEWRLPLYT